MFLRENVNPKGWKCGDCVVRALTKLSGQDWNTTFRQLCEIGDKKCRMPNDEKVFIKWLQDNGYVEYKPYRVNGNQVDVKTLILYLDEKYKHYKVAISTRKHLTCAIDGTVYDSWDVSRQRAGYYWLKIDNTPSTKELNEMLRGVVDFVYDRNGI